MEEDTPSLKPYKEKKSIVKSFKVSEEQLSTIEDKASSKGMNFSQIEIDCKIYSVGKGVPILENCMFYNDMRHIFYQLKNLIKK